MYTFALTKRDLVLGQQSFVTTTGSPKVAQDLTVATLEPFGCDRFHPGWGSVMGNYVGSPISITSEAQVYAEASRLVANYIATQSAVARRAVSNGQSNPYSSADIVTGISSHSVNTSGTTISAQLAVRTAADQLAVVNLGTGG